MHVFLLHMLAQVLRSNGCTTSQRAQVLEAYGAALILHFGTPEFTFHADSSDLNADLGAEHHIPSLQLTNSDGESLVHLIDRSLFNTNACASNGTSYGSLKMSVAGTGPITAQDLATLTAMAENFPLDPENWTIEAFGRVGNRPSWEAFLAGNVSDPCLERIAGVWCEEGRVVMLDCSSCHFVGPVPDEIGDLSELRLVSFAGANFMVGDMPCAFGRLRKLLSLNFDRHLLATYTPCLANLTQLEFLCLMDNLLVPNSYRPFPTEWSTGAPP
jgi:hypothetical protein